MLPIAVYSLLVLFAQTQSAKLKKCLMNHVHESKTDETYQSNIYTLQ